MQKTAADWQKKLAYWQRQAEDNERYWRVIRWFPLGVLVGAPVALYHRPLALLIVVSTLITWITGYYMIAVRRHEFRGEIREVQQQLREFEKQPPLPQ